MDIRSFLGLATLLSGLTWLESVNASAQTSISDLERGKLIERAAKFHAAVERLSPVKDHLDPDFAQRVNRKVEVKTVIDGFESKYTRSPTPALSASSDDNQIFPRSLVTVATYSRQLEVRIDRASYTVCSFYDGLLFAAASSRTPLKPNQIISSQQALSRGEKYVRETGIDIGKFVLESIEYLDKAELPEYYVRWVRVVNGVPMRHQWAHLFLDAQYGRLKAFHVQSGAPIPPPCRINVSPDQAEKALADGITKMGGQLTQLLNCQPEVSHGTGFWRIVHAEPARIGDRAISARTSAGTRYCWRLSALATIRDKEYNVVVYVDAETGEPLDGEFTAPRAYVPRPDAYVPPLTFYLARGAVVTVRSIANLGAESKGASIDPRRDYFALASVSIVRVADKHTFPKPTHVITLRSNNQVIRSYQYNLGERLVWDDQGRAYRYGLSFDRLLGLGTP